MAFYLLQFDGAITKNPGGKASYGFSIYRDGVHINSQHAVIGEGEGMTNNLAEHCALAEALTFLIGTVMHKPSSADTVSIQGDSQLVINQMSGVWRIKPNAPYTEYATKAIKLVNFLKQQGVLVSISWIPRELNQ